MNKNLMKASDEHCEEIKAGVQAREMAQQFRVLAVLLDDLGSLASTHKAAYNQL